MIILKSKVYAFLTLVVVIIGLFFCYEKVSQIYQESLAYTLCNSVSVRVEMYKRIGETNPQALSDLVTSGIVPQDELDHWENHPVLSVVSPDRNGDYIFQVINPRNRREIIGVKKDGEIASFLPE